MEHSEEELDEFVSRMANDSVFIAAAVINIIAAMTIWNIAFPGFLVTLPQAVVVYMVHNALGANIMAVMSRREADIGDLRLMAAINLFRSLRFLVVAAVVLLVSLVGKTF